MGILEQSADTPEPEDENDSAERAHALLEQLQALEESEDTTRLNAEVPTPLYERFREKCQREGVSMSKMVRRLVHVYVSD
jgi:predicted DNA binding CopG/RHH family protein